MNYKAITEKLNKFLSENKKYSAAAVIIPFVFIVLFFLSTDKNAQQEITDITTVSAEQSMNDIRSQIEEELQDIISNIDGTGNVSVMVSLASSGEFVYAENSRKENSGNKSSSDSEIVVFESDKGNNEGLIVSVKSPEISGVAVEIGRAHV